MDGTRENSILRPAIINTKQAPELLLVTDDGSNPGVLRTAQTDVYALGMVGNFFDL